MSDRIGIVLVAAAMLYLAPIVAGGVIVLFMLKPLLEIRDRQIVLERLLMLISQNSENTALINETREQMEQLRTQIQQLY